MIRFDSVSKRYKGAPRAALDDVTLEIGAGEFVFLVGASGSGKSTLMRLMLREEKPSTGEIHVLGQRLTTISTRKVPYFRRTLGVVFQDFRLLPNKTVYDNVAFTLQVIGKSRGFIQTAVPDVLATVGLADKAQNLPTELSGGEQQRVAIARAVVNKPSILLADEPTGNLDPTTSEGIMQVLERINVAGTTVVMATHDVTIVDKMQQRVVELVQGRIVRDELEASYVTSSLRLPRAEPRPEPMPEQPVWARRGGWAPPQATGPVDVVRQEARRPAPAAEPPRTGPVPAAARAAAPGPNATRTDTGPIWVRSDTGPILAPGEHAPWRAAPVTPADAPDGPTFSAPLPAQRHAWSARTGAVPVPEAPAAPASTGPQTVRPWSAAPEPEPRRAAPLPHHLDFVTGLGLRPQRSDDDDQEVGPTS